MERLVIMEGGQERIYNIHNRVVTVGRSSKNDIAVKDRNSSRKHCNILKVGDSWFVVDCDSQNGTVVNGQPIKKHELEDGDKITIGAVDILFLVVQNDEMQSGDAMNVDGRGTDLVELANEEPSQIDEKFDLEEFEDSQDMRPENEPAEKQEAVPSQIATASDNNDVVDQKQCNANDLQEQVQQACIHQAALVPKDEINFEPLSQAHDFDKKIIYEQQAMLKKLQEHKEKGASKIESVPVDKIDSRPPKIANAGNTSSSVKQLSDAWHKRIANLLPGFESIGERMLIALLAGGHLLVRSRCLLTTNCLMRIWAQSFLLQYQAITWSDFSRLSSVAPDANLIVIEGCQVPSDKQALELNTLESMLRSRWNDKPSMLVLALHCNTVPAPQGFMFDITLPELQRSSAVNMLKVLLGANHDQLVTSPQQLATIINLASQMPISDQLIQHTLSLVSNETANPTSLADAFLLLKAARAYAVLTERTEILTSDIDTLLAINNNH